MFCFVVGPFDKERQNETGYFSSNDREDWFVQLKSQTARPQTVHAACAAYCMQKYKGSNLIGCCCAVSRSQGAPGIISPSKWHTLCGLFPLHEVSKTIKCSFSHFVIQTVQETTYHQPTVCGKCYLLVEIFQNRAVYSAFFSVSLSFKVSGQ